MPRYDNEDVREDTDETEDTPREGHGWIWGLAAGAAAVGGGAYLIHRHRKKKREAERRRSYEEDPDDIVYDYID